MRRKQSIADGGNPNWTLRQENVGRNGVLLSGGTLPNIRQQFPLQVGAMRYMRHMPVTGPHWHTAQTAAPE